MDSNGQSQAFPDQPGPSSLGARPGALLDGVGTAAWEAFNAMQSTKQRHVDLLEAVDTKKKKYNIDATERDTRLLEYLLADHDGQVQRFAAAASALKAADSVAHGALFEYIGMINNALQPSASPGHPAH